MKVTTKAIIGGSLLAIGSPGTIGLLWSMQKILGQTKYKSSDIVGLTVTLITAPFFAPLVAGTVILESVMDNLLESKELDFMFE